MTIIMFLVDTSFSMNRKCYLGTSYLDVAKSTIELFMKFRAKDPSSRGDRYMLLTTEDYPFNIKAGWRENHATFMQELKTLKATTLTNLGLALRQAFDLLNINRLMSGIDTYGQGRCPFYLEYSVIILITDGSKITTYNKVPDEIVLPSQNSLPGSELTTEPFRWDQKLYSLILRLPGLNETKPSTVCDKVFTLTESGSMTGNGNASQPPPTSVLSTDNPSPLDNMCEVTGGRTLSITNHSGINASLEWMLARLQPPKVTLEFGGLGPPLAAPTACQGTQEWLLLPPPPPPLFLTGPNAVDVDMRKNTELPRVLFESACKGDIDERVLACLPDRSTDPKDTGDEASFTETTDADWWQITHKANIYVNPTVGAIPRNQNQGNPNQARNSNSTACHWWPVPESFWPDVEANTLPPRKAIPTIKYDAGTVNDVKILDGLPFDKYEIEPCPFTQRILALNQPSICWPVYMPNSLQMDDTGLPFGYIKPSTNMNCVNLYVLPYNYPTLIPLLEELMTVLKYKPSLSWKTKFDAYLKQTPPYYAGPLRKAFQKMGIQSVIPENFENCLSYSIISYLKKIKNQAKIEYDQLIASVGLKPVARDSLKLRMSFVSTLLDADYSSSTPFLKKILSRSTFTSNSCSEPKKGNNGPKGTALSQQQPGAKATAGQQATTLFSLTLPEWTSAQNIISSSLCRNPFDIARKDLIPYLTNIRKDILTSCGFGHGSAKTDLVPPYAVFDGSAKAYENQVPIGQMGNYQEYIKKAQPPLREIEITPARQHLFGNPFKVDKRMMMVDEADEWMVSAPLTNTSHNSRSGIGNSNSTNSVSSGSAKRRQGAHLPSNTVAMPFKRRRTLTGFSGPGPLPPDYVYVPSHLRTTTSPAAIFDDVSETSSIILASDEVLDNFMISEDDGDSIREDEDKSYVGSLRNDAYDGIEGGEDKMTEIGEASYITAYDVKSETLDQNPDDNAQVDIFVGGEHGLSTHTILNEEKRGILFEILENATAQIFYFRSDGAESRDNKRNRETKKMDLARRVYMLFNSINLEELFDPPTYDRYEKLKTRCTNSLKNLGQNYTVIYTALHTTQHDPILQLYLLRDIIIEARKFKRKSLSNILEQSMRSLYSHLIKFT